MPFIDIRTNTELLPETTEVLKKELARALEASFPGKTENWLMVSFRGGEDMFFAGKAEPCAMADVSVFGQQAKKSYDKMTAAVTAVISQRCRISSDRIYVKYTEYDKWGWNGGNF